jgi:hypothetical protein
MLKPNPIIASMAIDPHMAIIYVQVGKNMVEMSYWTKGCNVNIMMEELHKQLGLPSP